MTRTQKKVLDAAAEFIRSKGFPCGVWQVPPPDQIEAAQAAFDAELERLIDEMRTMVPYMLENEK